MTHYYVYLKNSDILSSNNIQNSKRSRTARILKDSYLETSIFKITKQIFQRFWNFRFHSPYFYAIIKEVVYSLKHGTIDRYIISFFFKNIDNSTFHCEFYLNSTWSWFENSVIWNRLFRFRMCFFRDCDHKCDQRPGPVTGFAENGARAVFLPLTRMMLHRCNNVACSDDHTFRELRCVIYFQRNREAKRAGARKYFFDSRWFLLIILQPRASSIHEGIRTISDGG